ncbi:MAG: glycogen synthase GlgA [Candidatus Aureabacteria bacterium]|nr:glycogen synthase GlgA [Candidatus Auribacterota bacterium]
MNILFAASEISPFAKTGGLADVAGSLPDELKKIGHDIRLIMPLYGAVQKNLKNLENCNKPFEIMIGDNKYEGSLFASKTSSGTPVYFIKNDSLYMRDGLYGDRAGNYKDNSSRFIFFCRAAIKACELLDFRPDIIHCNDWQTGLIPAYVKVTESENPVFKGTKTLYTIHNLAYQGAFWHFDMKLTGLPWSVFSSEGLEFFGMLNFMKSGIFFSDAVSTVSKNYSREIQTEQYSFGMEGILRKRKKDIYGIINGINYSEWNPETDKHIKENYSARNMSGKKTCKKDILEEFAISASEATPVIGIVSRLAEQKGVDLIIDAIPEILSMNVVLLILGKGDDKYHSTLCRLSNAHRNKLGIKLEFNEAIAHKIEAGCDFFLMPSRYEPCGLNQIYSLKYGTIPIVSATGGLDDTILNYNPLTGAGNGFKFKKYCKEALLEKIAEALKITGDEKHRMQIIKNGMDCDFSWNKSARQYDTLYKTILKKGAAL